MKKEILVIALLLAGTIGANAQVAIKGLVGMNFSTFHNTDAEVSPKAAYQYGAGVLIGDKFYVEPGIQFVRSSTTIAPELINPTAGFDETEFSQNFVKIPVYAGYHIWSAEDKLISLRLFAGPSVSIPGKIKKGADQIDKDNINNAIWAIDGGVGLDILFLFIEANYEYSLNEFFKDNISSAKHGAFIINAGVHIDF